MSYAELLCHCAEHYGIHHSECPVYGKLLGQASEIERLRQLLYGEDAGEVFECLAFYADELRDDKESSALYERVHAALMWAEKNLGTPVTADQPPVRNTL